MKKIEVILLAVILLFAGACKIETEHLHSFSSSWIYDSAHHWHEATCPCDFSPSESKGYGEHKFGEWSSPDGYGNKTRNCFCGYIDRSGHDHIYSSEWTYDDTYHWKKAVCIHSEEIGKKAEHDYGEWIITKPSTETTLGSRERTCNVCKYMEVGVVPLLPHERHIAGNAVLCDESEHWNTCMFNGCTEKMNVSDHIWGNEIITVQAGCTTEGTKTFTCSVCSYIKTEAIPAKGHSYSEEWTSDDTNHWHAAKCEHSDEKSEISKHIWGSWAVTKNASATEEGCKTRCCTECNYSETDAIPKLKVSPSRLLANKLIGENSIVYTSEVDIINASATVFISDGWQSDVFIKNRSVTLSPFAMGQYEVTQELFEKVMGVNPSTCIAGQNNRYTLLDGEIQKWRPVDSVNWYQAIAFCNKLSILEGLELCYSVTVNGSEIDWENLSFSDIPTSSNKDWNSSVCCDITKKGYRLPTEAELDFAARGGDPDSIVWNYRYSGVDSQTPLIENNFSTRIDKALDGYAWYNSNLRGGESNEEYTESNYGGYGTHAVGGKKPNCLGLYDMSGNVSEWCWDIEDAIIEETVINPMGPQVCSNGWSYDRCIRGGDWYLSPVYCTVYYRRGNQAPNKSSNIGFRIARSL